MRTDPARAIFHDDGTGIFVRAQTPEGRWISTDMAELDRDSLIEFMRSRGPVSDWARDLLILTLGHDREGLTPTLCEHGNALSQCPFTACSHFGEPWNSAPQALLDLIAEHERRERHNESVPLNRVSDLLPEPTAAEYRAALAGALDWEYVTYVEGSAYRAPISDIMDLDYGPATHRRVRAGDWEPVPDGDTTEPTAVIFGYGSLDPRD